MNNTTNINRNINKSNKSLHKIKIISVNVNSIIKNQRRASLMNLINTQKPDILLLSETKLNKKHILRFENYNIIRTDRNGTHIGGGTAIIIKKTLKYNEIKIPEIEKDNIVEQTIIKLNSGNNKILYIIAAYAKCGSQKEFIPDINRTFNYLKLDHLDTYYILAGDLNAKHTNWKNLNNNPRGIALNKWMAENSMRYKAQLLSTKYPSYPNGHSYLDIVIIDTRITLHDISNDHSLDTVPYDSDHNAIKFSVSLDKESVFELEDRNSERKYNLRNMNWEKFRKTLTESINIKVPNNRNLTMNEITEYIQMFDKKIQETLMKTAPKITQKNTVDTYINGKIRKLQKNKNKILSAIHHLGRKWPRINTRIFDTLKEKLRIIREELKNEFAISINNYWKNKIQSISKKDSAHMFPQLNSIFRKKEIAQINILKIPNNSQMVIESGIDADKCAKDEANNIVIHTLQEKLDVMGAYFASINNKKSDNEKTRLGEIIGEEVQKFKREIKTDRDNNITLCRFNDENTADEPQPLKENDRYFTNTYETEKRFRKLNNKKSCGLDGVPNIALKHIPNNLIYNYTILFNNLLNYVTFPNEWKKAKVIALLKKNKESSSPESYRPVSLLPNIGKVFESVINEKIKEFCSDKEIIPECQFGFRRQHSTLHAINRLTSDINWAFNNNQCIGACLIDLEKAFDTVWLDGLLFKLIRKGFPIHLTKIIWSMISNRVLITASGETYSTKTYKLYNGLQQGSVNAPILFNIYLSEMLDLFEINTPEGPQAIAFADDIIVYVGNSWVSRIQSKLQHIFRKVEQYCDTWRLKLNLSKCETILFRPALFRTNKNVKRHYKTFKIVSTPKNNISQNIQHKKIVKYLGINIDERLHYGRHVEIQIEKATKTFMSLKRLFYSKFLHEEIKLICYQLLIRPIITYGCPIWYNVSASLMEKIRQLERRCLRACTHLNRSKESDYTKYISNKKLYDKANISRIDTFIIYLTREHFLQASTVTHNSLIYAALYPNPMYYEKTLSTGNIPPEGFLYLDNKGYIQDCNGVPLIYHYARHNNNKRLQYEQVDDRDNARIWRYDASGTGEDNTKHKKKLAKYWWLTDNLYLQ